MPDPTLQEFGRIFNGMLCRWCGAELSGPLQSYNHEGGVLLHGFEMPQWVFTRCPKCRYDWSYRKIDILRYHTDRMRKGGEL